MSEFLGFGDYAMEYFDGSPTFTEGEVQNWSPGAVGAICYASYTIVTEIAEPVPSHLSTWGKIKACFRE